MGLHLKAVIGLTGISSCLRDPLISRYNSLPEGFIYYFVPRPDSIQTQHIQADCYSRASETGSYLEAVGLRKQTTPELDNPGDKPFYPAVWITVTPMD